VNGPRPDGAGSLLAPPVPLFLTVHLVVSAVMAEDRPISTAQSEYSTPPPSLPPLDGATLDPPRASYFSPGPSIGETTTPRDSRAWSATAPENDREGATPGQSTALLPAAKETEAPPPPSQPALAARPFYRRPVWLAVAAGALVALILAVILPVYFTVIRKSNGGQSNKSSNPNGSGNPTGPGSGNGNPTSPSGATSGGDGSTIISGNTTFVYSNPFGGQCECFPTSTTYVYVYGRLAPHDIWVAP